MKYIFFSEKRKSFNGTPLLPGKIYLWVPIWRFYSPKYQKNTLFENEILKKKLWINSAFPPELFFLWRGFNFIFRFFFSHFSENEFQWSQTEKNNSDQAYSCPREWGLSESGGINWGPSWNPPPRHHSTSTIVLRGLMEALNWSPIMPRDTSLSDSQCKIFQAGQWGFSFRQMHWENYISFSFHIEWDMIVVTVFLSIF